MDVSALGANAIDSNIGINVMKKAQKVQEREILGVLESATQPVPQSSSTASQSTGVGANLNISA